MHLRTRTHVSTIAIITTIDAIALHERTLGASENCAMLPVWVLGALAARARVAGRRALVNMTTGVAICFSTALVVLPILSLNQDNCRTHA